MSSVLKIAIVGAGPSGLYTAEAILELPEMDAVEIDIFDALPTPFGLVRYGIAPDHERMKSVTGTLQNVLDDERVRFFGNVLCGKDISFSELRAAYHGVVYALGADGVRSLEIEGDDAQGCVPAKSVIDWYSGYPDADVPPVLGAERIAVIGAGNVALDVVRMLIADPSTLSWTDVPDDVLHSLESSKVRHIDVVVRRGPEDVRFTAKELREFGKLPDVDITMPKFTDSEWDAAERPLAGEALRLRAFRLLREWSRRESAGQRRTVRFHFYSTPVAVSGDGRIEGLIVRPTDDPAGAMPCRRIDVGAVIHAIGYRRTSVPELPHDGDRHVIPSDADARLLRDGTPCVGEYVVGWARRGATGVLGTNKFDAADAARALRDDRAALARRNVDEPVGRLLAATGVQIVGNEAWQRINSAEIRSGASRDCARIKIATTSELLRSARVAPERGDALT